MQYFIFQGHPGPETDRRHRAVVQITALTRVKEDRQTLCKKMGTRHDGAQEANSCCHLTRSVDRRAIISMDERSLKSFCSTVD